MQLAGPLPSEPVFDLKDESATQWADEFDGHTGAQLSGDLVHAGKMEDVRWVKEIGLYKKISRAETQRRGITVVPIRWVVTDKGDPNRPKVRCRLVGRELRSRTKGTLLAHELRGKSSKCWDVLSAMMFRTQKVKSLKWLSSTSVELTSWRQWDREACIELPQEDKLPEDGDAVGLLLRSMYGFSYSECKLDERLGSHT